MPNWCSNVARISHENPQMIERMVGAAESGILTEFVPCPKELLEGEGWYDWCVSNWGTKWDLSEVGIDRHDANNLTLTFDSAWSPPIEAYVKLEEQGFVIEAYYYEPGMMFCGTYEDGCENTIEIEEPTFEWAHDNLPKVLDEMFGISDEFAYYDSSDE